MSEEEEEDISQLENLKSLVSQRLRETGALAELKVLTHFLYFFFIGQFEISNLYINYQQKDWRTRSFRK